MKIEIKMYQLLSIFFFGIFLIGLFFPWFSDIGLKVIHGTLLLSSLFPYGIILVLVFLGINLITITRKNRIYLHAINILPLAAFALLSLRLVTKYDEMPLGFGFYISMISLALTFVFCIVNILRFKKNSNLIKSENI